MSVEIVRVNACLDIGSGSSAAEKTAVSAAVRMDWRHWLPTPLWRGRR